MMSPVGVSVVIGVTVAVLVEVGEGVAVLRAACAKAASWVKAAATVFVDMAINGFVPWALTSVYVGGGVCNGWNKSGVREGETGCITCAWIGGVGFENIQNP